LNASAPGQQRGERLIWREPVFSCGAKGFIPLATGFEIAIEAVRFVLAGGTYVPLDSLLAAGRPDAGASRFSRRFPAATAGEPAVIRAIQQAKPNKIIARN
jgi:DNA-binding NarL/FixJ family response regulator